MGNNFSGLLVIVFFVCFFALIIHSVLVIIYRMRSAVKAEEEHKREELREE